MASKKAKRQEAGKKKAPAPQGRPGDYRPEFDEMARVWCRGNGGSDRQLGELFAVTAQTIGNWRTEHPTFAAAIIEGREEFDICGIQAGQVAKAKPHVKRTRELREVGPKPPASDEDKEGLVLYAKEKLQLKLQMRMSKAAMWRLIRREIRRRTAEKLVVVKEETVEGDTPAAKYALNNLGPPEKRWQDKQEVAHSGQIGLRHILGDIDGQGKCLPSDDGRGTDTGETGEQALAAQQPVLDNGQKGATSEVQSE